jgi:hypothetical protein
MTWAQTFVRTGFSSGHDRATSRSTACPDPSGDGADEPTVRLPPLSGATHSRSLPTASHRVGLRDGSIDWCCFHRFDARPVFARILDWSAGGAAALAGVLWAWLCGHRPGTVRRRGRPARAGVPVATRAASGRGYPTSKPPRRRGRLRGAARLTPRRQDGAGPRPARTRCCPGGCGWCPAAASAAWWPPRCA